jgi:hypothetical protein
MAALGPEEPGRVRPGENVPRYRGLLYVSFVFGVVISAVILLIYLLNLDPQGRQVPAALGVFLAILGLLLQLTLWLIDRKLILIRLAQFVRRLVAVAVQVGVISGGIIMLSLTLYRPSIPITETVTVSNWKDMANKSEASVEIPAPTRREKLTIVPNVTNIGETGNCADSARLDLVLLRDGVRAQSAPNIVQGTRVRFSLTGVVDTAAVSIAVRMRDPLCRVNLTIPEAVLSND